MKRPPIYWQNAKKILSKKDPVIRKIIKKYNKGFLTTRNNPFFSLCRTIIGQQISTKAADSIWLKFEKKCKKHISPNTVIKISSRNLRSAGLSRQKVSYLKNIAKAFINKSFENGGIYNYKTVYNYNCMSVAILAQAILAQAYVVLLEHRGSRLTYVL